MRAVRARRSNDVHKVSISYIKFGGRSRGCIPLLRLTLEVQRAIFSGVAVRAGIRMSARQNGPRGLPDYSRRDLAAFEFDNSQKKIACHRIFCWTRTAFFDTLATQSGEISRKIRLMKTCSLIAVGAVFMILTHLAGATQADDTTITITGHTAGAYALHQ